MASPTRVVIAGASGFIGRRLVAEFAGSEYDVTRIGRNESDATWGDQDAINQLIDGADVLINLAGKSVDCRYTNANRNEILRSRVDSTSSLSEAVAQAVHPPAIWLNASTSTIYRYSMDRAMNENSGEIGAGFSVDVAKSWEREFFTAHLPNTRRIALRMSIVIGDGPATRMLLKLGRFGLGGTQHDGWWFRHKRYRGIGETPTTERPHDHASAGRQKFSWIHIDDVVGSIRHIIDHPEISGPVNIVAPVATDNTDLMRIIRRVTRRRIGLPAYRWMLEPAMWMLRTEPELVLKSRWVQPGVLEASGYNYIWPELEPALRDVARSR